MARCHEFWNYKQAEWLTQCVLMVAKNGDPHIKDLAIESHAFRNFLPFPIPPYHIEVRFNMPVVRFYASDDEHFLPRPCPMGHHL